MKRCAITPTMAEERHLSSGPTVPQCGAVTTKNRSAYPNKIGAVVARPTSINILFTILYAVPSTLYYSDSASTSLRQTTNSNSSYGSTARIRARVGAWRRKHRRIPYVFMHMTLSGMHPSKVRLPMAACSLTETREVHSRSFDALARRVLYSRGRLVSSLSSSSRISTSALATVASP